MPSTTHLATIADDERHTTGPKAMPLWNESFWFPIYDPKSEIGVVLRAGNHAQAGHANLYLFITHHGEIIHTVIDQRLRVPAFERRRLTAHGLLLEWDPLESFRLRYEQGPHAFDLQWTGMSPVYKYPTPPDVSEDLIPRHIEHAGTVTGTVTIAGVKHPLDCLAHRDHSWGGERDWAKMYTWDYLNAEFGRDYWFNAVRIKFGPDIDYIYIGCVWDGRELHALADLDIQSRLTDGGTRQLGVIARGTDERGRQHEFVGEQVLVNVPVQFGRTWLKDGITRYRAGDRIGYGIHELGYQEVD